MTIDDEEFDEKILLAISNNMKLLSKLSVAELRRKLVCYGSASNAKDARRWEKSSMVEEIAVHMALWERAALRAEIEKARQND